MLACESIAATYRLWRACRKGRVTAIDVRDALVSSYRTQAESFLRRGMIYSDPHADAAALERRFAERARTFFKRLDSSFERPTLVDLREVQKRMRNFAHPGWAARLVGQVQVGFVERLFARAWREDPAWRSMAHARPAPSAPDWSDVVPSLPAPQPLPLPEPPPEWIGFPEDPEEAFDGAKTMRLPSGLVQARLREQQAPIAQGPPER